MRRALWIFIAGILASSAGRAQICSVVETVGECQARLESPQVQNALESRPSAPPTMAATGKKDFLPTLLTALQSAKLDSQKQELDLAWNGHLSAGDLQLQGVIRKPQVFQQLQDELNAAGNTAKLSEIESGLTDLQDVSVGVSFNRESQDFGRRFENQRDLFVPLFSTSVDAVRKADDRARLAFDKLHRLLNDPRLHEPNLEKVKISDISNVSESLRQQVEAAILEAAHADADFENQEARAIQSNGLTAFADLVDNQPQLNATVTQRSRAKHVGPDELSAQASLEYGFVSASGYRRKLAYCKKHKTEQVCMGGPLAIFKTYAANAEAGDRLTLTAEYHKTRAYSLNAASDGADISLPQARRWSAALTYGRRVAFDKSGAELGRIDAKASYENFSDDPQHQDRLVADFSYTQKVSASFSLPIGISYANHSYFLGDVQKRFSAHFGLTAKIFNGQ